MKKNPARIRKKDFLNLPYRPCVGAVLFNRDGLVWVGKRIPKSGDNFVDAWQMPQGGIDKGEDPKIAVFRELREETGIDAAEIITETSDWLTYELPEHLRGISWGGKYRGQKQKWYGLRFLGEVRDFDLNSYKKPEFSDWRWVPLQQVPELIISFKRDVYSKLATEFKGLPERVMKKS